MLIDVLSRFLALMVVLLLILLAFWGCAVVLEQIAAFF